MSNLHARVVEALREYAEALYEEARLSLSTEALLIASAHEKQVLALIAELADKAIVPNEQAVYVGLQRVWEREEIPAAVLLTIEDAKKWEADAKYTATMQAPRRYVCVPFRFGASDEQ